MILRPDRRGDLSDQQWPRLKPLLPFQKPDTGRPSNDHRTVINGILWVLRTGALPAGYTRMLRCLANGVRSLLLLAENRALAADFAATATTCRCRRETQLGHPFRGW